MVLDKHLDAVKDALINSVQESIKIKSVQSEPLPGKPFGEGAAAALEHALKLAATMGFNTVNLDGYVGYAEYGEGEEYIAILGHLDVVPEESGWTYAPYGGEIHEGKLYGRGAVDDKGPTIAALYALKAIKESGLKLSKKVRIIFGINEETGCEDMQYYMQKENPPLFGFTPDGDYPVIQGEKGTIKLNITKLLGNEGSAGNILKHIRAGERLNIVPDYCLAKVESETPDSVLQICKEFIDESGVKLEAARDENIISIESYGKSAHGSTPELGENAIMSMLRLLEKLQLSNAETANFIAYLNKHIGLDTSGSGIGAGLKDAASGNLSLNVGKITMNDASITIGCDIRFPVTYKLEDIIQPLAEKCSEINATVEVMEHNDPLYFPADHPLITSLQKVFTELTRHELPPKVIGGGTYAKYLPNTVAYGTIMPGKPHLEHQANEYIELDDLLLDLKIYAHAIYELAK